ncbi:hypothetical protein OG223_24390 [Streptomyces sp. NBC_01478]|uniref:hypothetical protein n=1 Tax=unclassified Streptomyces TaxID=2593676 RepID=UPI00131C9C8C|nr:MULTISPECIES: hypothetical protein [unclassified Streptomyces]
MENQDPGHERARSYKPEHESIRVPENASDLTPRFKLIFSTVAALTALALILNVLLAAFGGDSEQVKGAVEACSTTYMMGFGAIVGLIGGKVA